jgi:uncharacterized membrane protein YidH (DUF202 family)
LATRHEIEQWLEEGILAAKAGQNEQARFRLLDVVEQDQTNETAWFWLYQIFDRHDDKRICLENLITINSGNTWARQELLNYLNPAEAAQYQAPKPQDTSRNPTSYRPVILKLVGAFWLGISIILLGGGIMAIVQSFIAISQNRTFPNIITSTQAFEMLVAIVLVVFGLAALLVAIGLFFETTIGVYGSLFLALGLLLAGPTISLIGDPPNYLALVCTGGIAGMIVLLTLASHPSFSETQQKNGQPAA